MSLIYQMVQMLRYHRLPQARTDKAHFLRRRSCCLAIHDNDYGLFDLKLVPVCAQYTLWASNSLITPYRDKLGDTELINFCATPTVTSAV